MSYFPDLSRYTYWGESIVPEIGIYPDRIKNIGWIEREFKKGKVSENFIHSLDLLTSQPVRHTRGKFRCRLCGDLSKESGFFVPKFGQPRFLGAAEIQIPGNCGTWFAAPDLVHHYVTVHGYEPPLEFQEACENYLFGFAEKCEKLAKLIGINPDFLGPRIVRPVAYENIDFTVGWKMHESYKNLLLVSNGLSLLDPYDGVCLWGSYEFINAEDIKQICSENLICPIQGELPECYVIRYTDGSIWSANLDKDDVLQNKVASRLDLHVIREIKFRSYIPTRK